MNKYFFNKRLMRMLPELLNIPRMKFYDIIDYAQSTWRRWNDLGVDIMMPDFINVCNRLHIPASHFIAEEGDVEIYNTEEYYVQDENAFIPSSFTGVPMRELFGTKSPIGVLRTELYEEMSISQPTFERWASLKSSITVADFVKMCNLYDIDPNLMLVCPNRPVPYTPGREKNLFRLQRTVRNQNKLLEKQARTIKEQDETIDKLRQQLALLAEVVAEKGNAPADYTYQEKGSVPTVAAEDAVTASPVKP